jgi:hypothetical protein
MEEVETKFKPRRLTVKHKPREQQYSLPFIKKVLPKEDDPERYEAYGRL